MPLPTQAGQSSRGSLELSRDGRLLFATCAVRSFAYGFLSVMLGLYLEAIGLDRAAIGWIFTAALAGGALMTVALTAVADAWGRRPLLIAGAVLMALAGVAFAVTNKPILLALAAVFGTISPSGKEVGPFLSIEQAILPQATHEQNRTAIFSAYNLVASLSGALGALAVGLPSLFSLAPIAGYRLLVWGYVASALVMLVLFSFLSPAIEAKINSAPGFRRIGVQSSRGIVIKLAALFALDAFAGGFMGHVARCGRVDESICRTGVVYGSVLASFVVERFSVDRIAGLTWEEVDARYRAFIELTDCHHPRWTSPL